MATCCLILYLENLVLYIRGNIPFFAYAKEPPRLVSYASLRDTICTVIIYFIPNAHWQCDHVCTRSNNGKLGSTC